MRTRKFKRSTLYILRIAAVAGCLSLSAFAQTPSPTPSRACGDCWQLLAAILRQADRARGRSHTDAAKRDRRPSLALAGESLLVAGRARYHLRLCAAVARELRRRRRSLLVVWESRHHLRAGGERAGDRQQTRRDRPRDGLGRKRKQW